MKKFFILILLGITMVYTLSACSPSSLDIQSEHTEFIDEDSDTSSINDENETSTFTTEIAVITDINLDDAIIMIGESLDTDYESQTRVFIKENTSIYNNDSTCNLSDLSVGDQILITYSGGIQEALPSLMQNPIQIVEIEPTIETVVITDINLEHSTIMIGESLDTDYELQTRVFIKEYTKIIINGNPSSLEFLSVGTQIELTYTGGILEAAPSKILSPLQIKVIE